MAVKILVVNVNWLGDVIFSLPVFTALKLAFPDSSVACLAVARVRPILEHVSVLDSILECPESFRWTGVFGQIKLIHELRRQRFDKVYFLHRSSSRRFWMSLAGIPERIGYQNSRRFGGLTIAIDPPDLHSLHRSDYYLNVLEKAGISVMDRTSRLSVEPEETTQLRKKLLNQGVELAESFAVVHPGANWILKRWPPESYARLIKNMSRTLNLQVVLSGADTDLELHAEIQSHLGILPVRTVFLAGRLSLTETIVLLKMAKVMVSADSGPLHIANSLGTPVVGIYGPTRPEITGPRGTGRTVILQHDTGCNRRACYFMDCPDNICMKSVTVRDVMHALEQILSD